MGSMGFVGERTTTQNVGVYGVCPNGHAVWLVGEPRSRADVFAAATGVSLLVSKRPPLLGRPKPVPPVGSTSKGKE